MPNFDKDWSLNKVEEQELKKGFKQEDLTNLKTQIESATTDAEREAVVDQFKQESNDFRRQLYLDHPEFVERALHVENMNIFAKGKFKKKLQTLEQVLRDKRDLVGGDAKDALDRYLNTFSTGYKFGVQKGMRMRDTALLQAALAVCADMYKDVMSVNIIDTNSHTEHTDSTQKMQETKGIDGRWGARTNEAAFQVALSTSIGDPIPEFYGLVNGDILDKLIAACSGQKYTKIENNDNPNPNPNNNIENKEILKADQFKRALIVDGEKNGENVWGFHIVEKNGIYKYVKNFADGEKLPTTLDDARLQNLTFDAKGEIDLEVGETGKSFRITKLPNGKYEAREIITAQKILPVYNGDSDDTGLENIMLRKKQVGMDFDKAYAELGEKEHILYGAEANNGKLEEETFMQDDWHQKLDTKPAKEARFLIYDKINNRFEAHNAVETIEEKQIDAVLKGNKNNPERNDVPVDSKRLFIEQTTKTYTLLGKKLDEESLMEGNLNHKRFDNSRSPVNKPKSIDEEKLGFEKGEKTTLIDNKATVLHNGYKYMVEVKTDGTVEATEVERGIGVENQIKAQQVQVVYSDRWEPDPTLTILYSKEKGTEPDQTETKNISLAQIKNEKRITFQYFGKFPNKRGVEKWEEHTAEVTFDDSTNKFIAKDYESPEKYDLKNKTWIGYEDKLGRMQVGASEIPEDIRQKMGWGTGNDFEGIGDDGKRDPNKIGQKSLPVFEQAPIYEGRNIKSFRTVDFKDEDLVLGPKITTEDKVDLNKEHYFDLIDDAQIKQSLQQIDTKYGIKTFEYNKDNGGITYIDVRGNQANNSDPSIITGDDKDITKENLEEIARKFPKAVIRMHHADMYLTDIIKSGAKVQVDEEYKTGAGNILDADGVLKNGQEMQDQGIKIDDYIYLDGSIMKKDSAQYKMMKNARAGQSTGKKPTKA